MQAQGSPISSAGIAERVNAILGSKSLSLHQVSQESERLFGRSSSCFLPHNFYYDLRHGTFSPSVFQLFALSRISGYRLVDWFRVFGFEVEIIPRLQLQFLSKRTALFESSLSDPIALVPWLREIPQNKPLAGVVPLSQLLELTNPRRLGSLTKPTTSDFLYAKVGSEDAMAFPELLPGSVVRVNLKLVDEALKRVDTEGSANLFLVEHAGGFLCCHVRTAGRGRIAIVSNQLSYAQVEFRVPEEVRIIGVADLEIRSLVKPRQPSIPKALARRWRPQPLSPQPPELGALLRRARRHMGLSFREASAISREIASVLADERYFAASGSLSDYEKSSIPPRHLHKLMTFCMAYFVPLNTILQAVGIDPASAGQEPMPNVLTGLPVPPAEFVAESDELEHSGVMGQLIADIQEVPFFLRDSIDLLSGLPKPSLKDFFWIGGTGDSVHPCLADGILVVVNRQKKKPNDCGSKPPWQQALHVVLSRDGTYLCGCCGRENNSLIVHTYPGGVHKREQLRNQDAEVIGRMVVVLRKLT